MMKCRKGLVAGVVAVCMMGAMGSTSVFAENKTSDTTTLTYSVSKSYTWSVPATIEFTSEDTVKTGEVKVGKNVIGEGENLKITIKGSGTDGAFVIKNKANGKTHELNYKVGKSATEGGEYENVKSSTDILTVAAGTNTGSIFLQFELTKDTTEIAGDYEGVVSYTATVE